MRNILAVGAYERDNFGDYLFLEVLRRALPSDNVIPGSVIARSMKEEYGIVTVPYDYVLNNHEIDAVWVVGGEVGGVRVPGALEMSVGKIFDNTPFSYEDGVGMRIEHLLGATRSNRRAYIPDMRLYEKNREKPLFIQSVGLSNIFADTIENKKLLTQAKRLVVRESYSYDLCRENHIRASLAPDVVHSLAKFYSPKKQKRSGIMLQMNEATFDTYSIERVGAAMREVYEKYALPITLFAAGTASGHDSLHVYNSLVTELKGVDVKILNTRHPLEIVDHIASADVIIATSLHARIIAATYDIPRISMENQKVHNYAKEWDDQWPTSVGIDNLVDTLNQVSFINYKRTGKNKLTNEAYDALIESIHKLPKRSKSSAVIQEEALVSQWFMKQQEEAIRFTIESQEAILRLEKDLQKTRYALNEVVKSKAWQYLSLLRKYKSRIIRK